MNNVYTIISVGKRLISLLKADPIMENTHVDQTPPNQEKARLKFSAFCPPEDLLRTPLNLAHLGRSSIHHHY